MSRAVAGGHTDREPKIWIVEESVAANTQSKLIDVAVPSEGELFVVESLEAYGYPEDVVWVGIKEDEVFTARVKDFGAKGRGFEPIYVAHGDKLTCRIRNVTPFAHLVRLVFRGYVRHLSASARPAQAAQQAQPTYAIAAPTPTPYYGGQVIVIPTKQG